MGLPDDGEISERIFAALTAGHLAHSEDMVTLSDFKALQMGWVFEINFQRSFGLIRQRRYLERIRRSMPDSHRADIIYARAHEYVEKRCGESPG
jgi:hypothetical protein